MASRVSRRAFLVGGGLTVATSVTASAFLVDAGVLPGQSLLNEALGRCDVTVPAASVLPGGSPGGSPGVSPGPVVDGSFESGRRRARVGFRLAYPPGSVDSDHLPVCLVLHGFGQTARDAIDAGRYDRYLAAAVAGGLPPFVLAACDGGPGYWHRSASAAGTWAGRRRPRRRSSPTRGPASPAPGCTGPATSCASTISGCWSSGAGSTIR